MPVDPRHPLRPDRHRRPPAPAGPTTRGGGAARPRRAAPGHGGRGHGPRVRARRRGHPGPAHRHPAPRAARPRRVPGGRPAVTLVPPARRRPRRRAGPPRGPPPCRTGRLGWPGPAASWSRASTTPSWWRRCGATTCGSRASWSSGSTAWTTSPTRSTSSDPGPGRRLGVLLDHLVDGTKEARVAAAVRHPDVLVRGTPYVDVWQAVRPRAAGIDAWPEIPRGRPWKEGVIAASGCRRRRASSGARCWPRCRPSPTSTPPWSARSRS